MRWFDKVMELGCMITTVEKKDLRKRLLDACITKQQLLMEDFRQRIASLMQGDGGVGETYDNADVAEKAARVSEINVLNEQLEFAGLEFELLENLKISQDLERDRVGLGAIVVANHHRFFVSASLEKFIVDGQVYVGISMKSPIYRAMDGMREGEHFIFRGVEYKIEEVL